MYQRPRANGKGVSFADPDVEVVSVTNRLGGSAQEPSAKKRKLSEPEDKLSSYYGSPKISSDIGASKYQYSMTTRMALGSPEAKQSAGASSSPPSASDDFRSQADRSERPVTSIDLETVELKAEPIIHFSKLSMREAASKAQAYAPSTESRGVVTKSRNSSSPGAPGPFKRWQLSSHVEEKEGEQKSGDRNSHFSDSGGGQSEAHGDYSVAGQDGRAIGAPWVRREYSKGVLGLDEEIWDFYRWLQPTREERMLRFDLVERLRHTLKSRFPHCEVRFFGSLATDLLLPTSDVDLVVLGVQSLQSNLWIVRSLLSRNGFCHAPTVIAHAKVPLVKFTDSTTGIDVDISFDHANGLSNTQIINAFATKYKTYRPLLVTLKFYLQQLAINEPYNGGLGSYSLSLMLASFLQMHPKTNNASGRTEANLGYLLLDFFALYGKQFNYFHTGISVRGDGSYFSKIERGWIDEEQPFLASIEDPNDETNDVGRSTHRILTIRTYFKDAFMKLSNLPRHNDTTLLSRIIWPDTSLEHRRSHLPGLVSRLMKTSRTFKKNTQPIADMYEPNGELKEGASHTALGEAQASVEIKQSPHGKKSEVLQHLMFESDDEEEEDKRFFTSDAEDTDSDEENDRLAPIVISSDDDSSEMLKGESKRSQSKKRKRWH